MGGHFALGTFSLLLAVCHTFITETTGVSTVWAIWGAALILKDSIDEKKVV